MRASSNRSQNEDHSNDAQIGGGDLYMKIKDHLTTYLQRIFQVRFSDKFLLIRIFLQNGVDLQGDNILRFYSHHWSQYEFPSKVLNSICLYLNAHWVKQGIGNQEPDVYEVYIVSSNIYDK